VSIETEIKIRLADPAQFRRRLESLKPVALSSRHFEDNFLLDYPDRRIQGERCLIRVRRAGYTSLLTFKGPPRSDGLFKVREELETEIESGDTIIEILEKLGLRVWFRYQKYREEFRISTQGAAGEEVHVAIDETPVGGYSEIEGSEQGIREVAGAMGFGESHYLRGSYYSLYLQYCRERGLSPTHMVFPGVQDAQSP
jgi:predicted adenylyl cyclase CyaB